MQDKETRKKPDKVTDVDNDGEPIRKIETPESRIEQRKRSEVPLFLRKSRSAAQGNSQDEKDNTPE